MPDRRTVLKTTALSILSSALPISVRAGQLLSSPVVLVYENGIAESIAFRDALTHRATGIHCLRQDPAETFRELSRVLQAETIVLGCSKGAAAFVLGELARGQGAGLQVFGEHRYLPGKVLQHTLRIADAGIERAQPADNWGSTIAKSLGAGLPITRLTQARVITTTMDRPATSPDYLVTWGFLP